MDKFRSYLIKHRGLCDKVMLGCFVLGLILIGIALAQSSAFMLRVEAEFNAGDRTLNLFVKGDSAQSSQGEAVSTTVTTAVVSEPPQSVVVNQDPWDAIDFSPGGAQITLEIMPDADGSGEDQSIRIIFSPADHCEFGDGHACVYQFTSSAGKQVIMISVHSGWGAEAEAFRNFLEGTGLFKAGHTLDQVEEHMAALLGSGISLEQGNRVQDGFTLLEIIRVPPAHFNDYMALPIEKTLDYAGQLDLLDPSLLNQDLFVFETCGWKLPGEEAVAGLDYTSNAIYLGLIQFGED